MPQGLAASDGELWAEAGRVRRSAHATIWWEDTPVSELDGLVSRDGVLLAGRFGPDWRVAETKTRGLFFEIPAALGVMGSFCEAVQSVLNALAVAMGGFSPSAWTPVHGWAASGGSYSIAVHGDRFVVVETDRVGSFDELRQLLGAGEP